MSPREAVTWLLVQLAGIKEISRPTGDTLEINCASGTIIEAYADFETRGFNVYAYRRATGNDPARPSYAKGYRLSRERAQDISKKRRPALDDVMLEIIRLGYAAKDAVEAPGCEPRKEGGFTVLTLEPGDRSAPA